MGTAREWGHEGELMSPQVVTRWYRAPELLYGALLYDGRAVDIWAMACIMLEMYNRAPLFPGSSDIDQLGRIFAVCGTPNATSWPDCDGLPDYLAFEGSEPQSLASVCPKASPNAIALISSILQLDPRRRMPLSAVLGDTTPYWKEAPSRVPCSELLPMSLLPKYD